MQEKIGKYRHFKGKIYQILYFGFDSETLEKVVIYQGQYDSPQFGTKPIFVRPYKQFFDFVQADGFIKPRFEFVDK